MRNTGKSPPRWNGYRKSRVKLTATESPAFRHNTLRNFPVLLYMYHRTPLKPWLNWMMYERSTFTFSKLTIDSKNQNNIQLRTAHTSHNEADKINTLGWTRPQFVHNRIFYSIFVADLSLTNTFLGILNARLLSIGNISLRQWNIVKN